MNDGFLEDLSRQWRAGARIDPAHYVAEIERRRDRLNREAALAAAGALLVSALVVGFGLQALHDQSLLSAVGALAFACAVPPLLATRARATGRLRAHHESHPDAHMAAVQADLEDERRRLGEARVCTTILSAAALAAFGLFAVGLESRIALLPASAWAMTAALVEVWRRRAAQRLLHARAALEHLHRQVTESGPDAV